MKGTVFYSWQSDVRAAACRSLIQHALEKAVVELAKDVSLDVQPVVDRDTQGLPGSPDIGTAILAKIDAATAIVADVTLVARGREGRAAPNSNVLIECGYALKALGLERIVLVQNTAFGGPEQLPFDLRQKRVLTYSSPEDSQERAPERLRLQEELKTAIRSILSVPRVRGRPDVDLRIDYKKQQISQKVHHYRLVVILSNTGTKRFDDWEVEVVFPTLLLEPGVIVGIKDNARSDASDSFFVASRRAMGPIRPGDRKEVTIGYRVDDDIYFNRPEVFERMATARALVDGEIVAEVRRSVSELQQF